MVWLYLQSETTGDLYFLFNIFFCFHFFSKKHMLLLQKFLDEIKKS
jgi:hypothetical protein